jgi:fatty-acyl-CoA synthase
MSGLTFVDVLDDLAAVPDRIGVIDDDGPHTWAEIRDEATAIARALVADGVAAGDRVACLMRNRVRWISCAVATTSIGAVFVPLNTWYRPAELRWTLRHNGASVLLAEEEFLGHDWVADLAVIRADLPALRTLVWTGTHAATWSAFLERGTGISEATLTRLRAAVDADAGAFVLYTSGSTGDPKGVVLSQQRMLTNSRGNAERRGITAVDRIWLGSPLFYGLGATNVLPLAMMSGAALVMADRFEPEGALTAIETYGVTTFCGVSTMIRRIVESPGFRRERVATLRRGNAGIGRAERALLIEEMDVDLACSGYGVTELSGMCFVGDPDDPVELKLAGAGYLLPGFEAVIVDPTTREPLPAGDVGLLLVRGLTALGYLDAPADVAVAFGPDGFYDTGDLGAIDADGRFWWHERVKEMIKTRGINVSPAEIEHLLLDHPMVSEAYVLGLPDREQGELAAAVVVLAEDGAVTARELRAHIRERAAAFKVPARVEFRSAADIPRTTSGKVAKVELRTQLVTA